MVVLVAVVGGQEGEGRLDDEMRESKWGKRAWAGGNILELILILEVPLLQAILKREMWM